MHTCPQVTPASPPVPHVGGIIIGTGCASVLIAGMPAATLGDACSCNGSPPDSIISGSGSVMIGGRIAARMGDNTEHGGKVTGGCLTVLIGGDAKQLLHGKLVNVFEEELELPWDEERVKLINQTIAESITLLERKLKLLKNNDPKALLQFKKWFGTHDEVGLKIIKRRITKALKLCQNLTVNNFDSMSDERDRKIDYASVNPKDTNYIISLGDPFWNIGPESKNTRAGVLVHELSHFKKIGKTKDHAYDEECFNLGEKDPKGALYNADSFKFFIEE
jgi:uncharacterized Zn-binding protein involved in type VI secretion